MIIIEINAIRRILVHHGLYIPQFRYSPHGMYWNAWIVDSKQIEFTTESEAYEYATSH